MKNSLMWFRYDLRIKDNEALFAASENEFCLPIFIFDEDYLKLQTTSDFHLNFLNNSLLDLKNNLKEKFNVKLNLYNGKTIEILDYLISKFKITNVYSNKIFKGEFFNRLDNNVNSLFIEKKVNWIQKNQFGVQLNKRVRGKWSVDWQKFVSIPITPNIESKYFLEDDNDNSLFTFPNTSCQQGGEKFALSCLESFLNERHKNYSKKMSSPLTAEDSCSRLSPHLSFGTISIKYILNEISKKKIIDNTSINSFKKDSPGIVILYKNFTMNQVLNIKTYTRFIMD